MKHKMYHYFDDYKKWLILQVFALLSYIGINIGHSAIELHFDRENGLDETQDSQLDIFIYYELELLGVFIFIISKLREDLFLQLNRDRTILKTSRFQRDYLTDIDRSLLDRIKVTGSHRELKQ